MHNILVTGANGQLGSELRALEFHYPSYNFIFTDSEQLDITTYRAVETDLFQKSITPKKKSLSLSTKRKPFLQWHRREQGAPIGVVLSLFS